MSLTPDPANAITEKVLGLAFRVHTTLGPGLLESIYEACLEHEIEAAGLAVERQVNLPIVYDGVTFDEGYRVDLLVEKRVIIEVKAVATILPIFRAQLATYLRLAGLRVGLLLNFNVIRLKDGGIVRVMDGRER